MKLMKYKCLECHSIVCNKKHMICNSCIMLLLHQDYDAIDIMRTKNDNKE